MPEDYQRTEPATPRRREEVRRRGQVARSVDVNSALILLSILIFVRYAARYLLVPVLDTSSVLFRNAHNFSFSTESVSSYAASFLLILAKILAPVLVIAFVVALVSGLFQAGFVFSASPLAPTLDRMNPVTGFSRIFSTRSSVELLKSFFKIVLVGYVAYAGVRGEIGRFPSFTDASPLAAALFFGDLAYRIGLRIVLLLLFLALVDYAYQRYEFEKSIRMTKQEIRDELKQLEGDPLLRARIRQRQREIARRRMMMEVPRADVVITNPVHLAVALRYDPVSMAAPAVIAKGQRLIADRIREIAASHNIPIVEDPELARVLFKDCEVGSVIPGELYRAVAEILAWIYNTNKGRKRAI